MKKEVTKVGIVYTLPEVALLASTPLASSEIGARVCHDSFAGADNIDMCMYEFGDDLDFELDESELLEDLSHIYKHGSVLEHTVFTFHIRNMSRGVLQELARHRIASYSVRSTRYTMGDILIKGLIYGMTDNPELFVNYIINKNVLVLDGDMARLEARQIFDKLKYHREIASTYDFEELILSKKQLAYYGTIGDITEDNKDTVLSELSKLPYKRNVGDDFKYIVSDNWATELAMTINLRSLKNFMGLRMSNAAYFQIRHLATSMFDLLPEAHKRIILKNYTPID